MINTCDILHSVNCFNAVKVGDRIFYYKNGHATTKRITKKGRKTVTVIENGVEKTIRYDRIFQA